MSRLPDINGGLAFVATILAAVIGVLALQNIYQKGSEPPKKLEFTTFSATNPVSALSKDSSPISVKMQAADGEVKNVRVVTTFIQNVGSAPIKPDDIVEPLGLEAAEGWTLLNVVSSGNRIEAEWNSVENNRFEVEKKLLNPRDLLIAEAYLTFDGEEPEVADGEYVVEWRGRIVNLDTIAEAVDPMDEFSSKAGPFVVTLWIWPIVFILVVFFLTSLYLISAFLSFGARERHYSCYLLGIVLVVNLCSTEAVATLTFGGSPFDYQNAPLSLNLPIILINVTIFGLVYLGRRKGWTFTKAASQA